jgi:formiminoglutamase/agmatinase
MAEPTLLFGDRNARKRISLLGVPYDSAVSIGRPGARYAPERIRAALRWNLMRVRDGAFYDVEGRRVVRLDQHVIEDWGDCPVFGDDHSATLEHARRRMAEILASGAFPIGLGGDHAVTIPLAQAFHDHHDGPLGIIHVDAHLDLVDENPRQGRQSGSSPMRRSLELGRFRPENLVQVGVRGFNYPEQYEYIARQGIHHITAGEVHDLGGTATAKRAYELASAGGAKVYLSFDMDAMDYAFAPGTGADEAGGFTTQEILPFFRYVAPMVAAMDIVEVNPMTDHQDATSGLAAQIIFTAIAARVAQGV